MKHNSEKKMSDLGDIPAEHVAVIAAACAAYIATARIVLRNEDVSIRSTSAWILGGRMALQASRKPRR